MIYSIQTAVAIDPSEEFYVDSNILYALYSENLKQTQNEEKYNAYLHFVFKLMKNKNPLYVSSLNLQEVFHVIEKAEFRDYCKQNHTKIKWKMYRKNKTERKKVKNKLLNTLHQINSVYEITEDSILCSDIHQFVNTFEKHQFDPIDFLTVNPKCFLAGNCKKNFNYITDDSDFKNNIQFQSSVFMNIYSYEKNEN
ncbi:hypothetical protein MmiAt1_17640 [Methanimicrococcus sp. At1]|uniref:PIN domain-containing protein n=1 Tax=Methanimicrococcus hacksteinii TaxID=3028293 RepID=A0ABU3VRX2_9EURY|nr:hypothetical protein [Methanimicrococcus sp. At1]MDV0446147.1 hypothetical protein [Methanimicrococcus sp. At1]